MYCQTTFPARLEIRRSLLNSKIRTNMEQCSDWQRKTSNSEQIINMGLETPFTYSNLCSVCLSHNFEQLYFWKKVIVLHYLFSLIFKETEFFLNDCQGCLPSLNEGCRCPKGICLVPVLFFTDASFRWLEKFYCCLRAKYSS